MDKMFARFEGRKSLKKIKNVDVHDDKVKCDNDRDNIEYVEVLIAMVMSYLLVKN